MKVVIFYPYNTGENAFSGGVAKVIVSNIIAVHLNGDEPILIHPEGNTGLEKFVKENYPYCKTIPIPFATLALFSDTKNLFTRAKLITKNLIGVIRGRKRLKEALETIKPDVIHFHEINCYNILGLYKKAKIIFHIHSYRFTGYKFVSKQVYAACNKHADVIISPTVSIKEAMKPFLRKEVTIVRTPYLEIGKESAVTTEASKKIEETRKNKIVFSFIGRICTIKRIDHFVKALTLIPEEMLKKIEFVIIGGCNFAGDFAYKDELKKIAREAGIEHVLNFVGYVNPVESVLPHIDYGVMLTESEAMPMVGIEYMRFNVPIVAYAAPGIADFMVNEETGFLLKNGSIQTIADILKRIVQQENIPDFESTIPEHFKGYSIDNFAQNIKFLYQQTPQKA